MNSKLQIDQWVWGNEKILWGFDSNHQYTLKILEPKIGRQGCLSLQYHDQKSETWIQYRGKSWILVADQEIVACKILNPGEVQNLPAGTLHRLMGVSADCQVIEPSTPDRHAADKSVQKDVVRLHCVQGRECAQARTIQEEDIVKRAIELTEKAITAVEQGQEPESVNPELFDKLGFYTL